MSDLSLQTTVALGERSYPILAAGDLSDQISTTIAKLKASAKQVVLITDTQVAAAQADWIERVFGACPKVEIPAGESSKSFAELERLCLFLAEHQVDRHGVIFALGGGVVGDLAGCAAGLYLRGISFFQIPTSLLAMVDSSVGGKTGINLPHGKNLVGVFHQPLGVFLQARFLETLSPEHFASGMGEVIKHALILPGDLLQDLEEGPVLTPTHPKMPEMLLRNCQIKANVVAADERESAASGGRALLNLGHTFAHAIEAVAGYGDYLHGEAVAIGLVGATILSHKLGFLPESDIQRIEALLQKYKLPIRLHEPLDISQLLNAMRHDKKNRSGNLRMVILKKIGQAATIDNIDLGQIEEIWQQLSPQTR